MNKNIEALVNNIEKVIVGKTDVIVKVIAAMLADGHVLLEDIPGVGKTQLVACLAKSVDGKFNRIQLTPDIMPSDIVGFSMINAKKELEYRQGVAFCNFLLADEINRASPKSQSALLEIMEEHQISIDGKTYPLPSPFMTLATQNPVETYGTYHLPEAQMDRFIIRVSIGYPKKTDELVILDRNEGVNPIKNLKPVMSLNDITKLQDEVKKVYVSPAIRDYIVSLSEATRCSEYIRLGASPRASISLFKISKSFAFIQGRDYVTADDVKIMAPNVMAHRIILSPKGKAAYSSNEAGYAASVIRVSAPIEKLREPAKPAPAPSQAEMTQPDAVASSNAPAQGKPAEADTAPKNSGKSSQKPTADTKGKIK